jgi:hypothetical protein
MSIEVILRVCQRIPYAKQLKIVLIEEDSVRFEWRGQIFRVQTDLCVEEVQEKMLVGSNASILLEALLKV